MYFEIGASNTIHSEWKKKDILDVPQPYSTHLTNVKDHVWRASTVISSEVPGSAAAHCSMPALIPSRATASLALMDSASASDLEPRAPLA